MTERGGIRFVARRRGKGVAGAVVASTGALASAGLLAMVLVCTVRCASAEVYSYRDRRGVQHFTNVPTDTRYQVMPLEHARVTRISYFPRGGSSGSSSRGQGLARVDRLWNPPPADLEKLIAQTAQRYGVETALVHAVVRAESDFDHLAISSAGARGLMQLMPDTASEVGVRDAFHPQQNLEGGVYYLRQLIDRFAGNVQLALAGYNAGPGAVERFGGVPPYAETLDYLQRVFRFRQDYLLSHRFDRPRVVVASR